MDFIAHFLWSFIIFSGPQLYLALFFGVFPDLIPFGLNIAVRYFSSQAWGSRFSEYAEYDGIL